MSFKILTENSVDNTNIDGARAEHFNAGLRDGIVKGAFNEGIFSALASNVISFDTCELRISGHRIINNEIWTQTFSSSPSVATRYALVGQVVVNSSSNVEFSLFVQNAATQLAKDNLFRTENGAGTYQVEIGRFTLTTLGTITDIVRTLDTITGGSSGKGEHFVSGNMTTVMLESGMQANVIAEDQYNANGEYQQTNMTWELPETAGTVVKVNDVEQGNIEFRSDPQTQLDSKTDKQYVDELVASVTEPTGAIIMFSGTTAPNGWLICNGDAISRTTYADLFAVVGTTYGTGDGSTTFNLPNLSGKFPIGASSSFSLPLGTTGGSASHTPSGSVTVDGHTLTTSEIPSHRHSFTGNTKTGWLEAFPPVANGRGGASGVFSNADSGGDYTYTGTSNNTRKITRYNFSMTPDGNTDYKGDGNSHNHTASFSGTSQDTRPPYLALNFIIKY